MDQLTQPSPVLRVPGPPPAAREARSINVTKLKFYCRYVIFELPDSIVDFECVPHIQRHTTIDPGQCLCVLAMLLNILDYDTCIDGIHSLSVVSLTLPESKYIYCIPSTCNTADHVRPEVSGTIIHDPICQVPVREFDITLYRPWDHTIKTNQPLTTIVRPHNVSYSLH